MHDPRLRRLWALCRGERFARVVRRGLGVLVALLIVGAMLPDAVKAREFVGFYAVTDVTDLEGEVELVFTIRLFNHGEVDAPDSAISLEDPFFGSPYITFTDVFLGREQSVWLRATAIVPVHEFEYWEKGGKPTLLLEFIGEDGGPLRREIELIRLSPGEEV